MRADEYNYPTFPSDDDPEFFQAFFEHLKPGESAPDAALIDLGSGDSIQIGDVIRQYSLTTIELGSFT
jgi:hypothetical protein